MPERELSEAARQRVVRGELPGFSEETRERLIQNYITGTIDQRRALVAGMISPMRSFLDYYGLSYTFGGQALGGEELLDIGDRLIKQAELDGIEGVATPEFREFLEKIRAKVGLANQSIEERARRRTVWDALLLDDDFSR